MRKQWILALLVVLTVLLGLTSGCIDNQNIGAGEPGITISASLAYSIIEDNKDNPNFILLDIRTPEEFATERIAKSILIDFYADDFKNELNKLDKSKTYLVYCRSGNRSSQSIPIMKDLNFTEFYDMGGGINQWKAEGYPTIQ